MFTRIADQRHICRDTCNVYVLCSGREAVLVDFGSGDVLDHLAEIPDLGAEGFLARILPYQVVVAAGEVTLFEVEIRNPFPYTEEAIIRVVAPQGWEAEPAEQTAQINRVHQISFKLTPPHGLSIRRARLAVDLTIAGQRFGQQAEVLVTVLP